jgi:signal recognition particle GTPase
MTMMDSMTAKELDNPNPKIFEEHSRLMRIAKGSGQHPFFVRELVGKHSLLL